MKIGIIGAGITGLSAAYELIKKGHEVVIFERAPVPGGLGTYLPVGDSYLERYYHHFFESDVLIKQYAEELGVGDKLKFYPDKTSIFINGKIYPFNSPQDLLRYDQLSFFNRLRCGVTTGFLKFTPFPISSLDTISAADWIKRFAGKEVYNNLWGPLLEGKFSQFSTTVPALWLWGRVHDRSFKLGYFDGSVKVLFDGLINAVQSKGGMLHLGAEIKGVRTYGKKVAVLEGNKRWVFDRVIITTVSPIAEKLMQDKLPTKYRSDLQKIDHLGAVCVILELKKRVQSQYWVNICEKGAPVLVMVEHTNFLSPKAYGGKHLIYLANYLHRDDPRFKLSDKDVLKQYTSILKKMNPKFDSSWISNATISRVPRAQTIFGLHSLITKPAVKTKMKNVYLVNIDQMYPHDRNLNQGIELGMKAASMI